LQGKDLENDEVSKLVWESSIDSERKRSRAWKRRLKSREGEGRKEGEVDSKLRLAVHSLSENRRISVWEGMWNGMQAGRRRGR